MQDNDNNINTPDAAIGKAVQNDFVQKIVEKINSSENILIALAKDPSVDEIAAAIGLTMYLDGMQKHTTAIYSGHTPDNLSFLQPDATFENNTDSLQDFIISLSKDKADHLRYKLEGDFVKVFITPYKANITEEDLSFSHGDYNVDFVIALNVPSAGNLDAALHEHGRIMHDASAVNITTGNPGRFGEIEWSDPTASSLCEMVTRLIFAIQGNDEAPLDKDIATALLAGIVAATNRFSNERTNPDTLGVASKLMSMGADQKMITSNIDGNEVIHNTTEYGVTKNTANAPKDRTNLEVEHGGTPAASQNPYAEGGPLAGMVGQDQDTSGSAVVNPLVPGAPNSAVPGANPAMPNAMPGAMPNMMPNAVPGAVANPAAQVAPNLNMAASPAPANIASVTQNVVPDSAVVQPVIPGAPAMPNATVAAPAAPNAAPVAAAVSSVQMQIPGQPVAAPTTVTPVASATPAPAAAPAAPANTTSNGSRPMATSEPAQPTSRQVGNSIQPPTPKPKQSKNYAEMMEEALSEPLPNAAADNNQSATPAAPSGVTSSTMNLPGMSSAPAAAPATIATPAAPAMEPVANPNSSILPPPPSPTAGMGMMPPVLPPVQMPPEATK